MKSRATYHWFALALILATSVRLVALAADSTNTSDPAPATLNAAASTPHASSTQQEHTAADAKNAPRTDEIAAWIADLDDNRYLVREAATRRLLEAGVASFDYLLNTANGDRPEPADRATWILRRLSSGKDQVLRRQALERLVLLKNRPQVVTVAQQALAELRHTEAVAVLQALGARYVTSEYGMSIGFYYTPRLELDQQWRGTDADLVHVRNLVAVRQVAIFGTDISIEGLAHLQRANWLQESSLLLYGSKLEADEVPKVQKLLPQVEVDYRRGGLLGVGSNTPEGMGSAVVGIVKKGSAAEAVGIRVGDIVQEFENQPVPNFKALTLMIGKHRAGDEVTLEVVRNGQPMEFKVTLDAWQSAN
jgi:hypothetical protein